MIIAAVLADSTLTLVNRWAHKIFLACFCRADRQGYSFFIAFATSSHPNVLFNRFSFDSRNSHPLQGELISGCVLTFGWGANTTWGGGLGGDVTVANTSDLSKLAGTSTNQGLVLPAGRFSANLDYVRMKGGYEGFSASGLYGLDIPTPAQAAKLVELLDFDPTDYGVHGNISGTANFAFLARVVNPDGTRSWKVWTSLQVFDETAQ